MKIQDKVEHKIRVMTGSGPEGYVAELTAGEIEEPLPLVATAGHATRPLAVANVFRQLANVLDPGVPSGPEVGATESRVEGIAVVKTIDITAIDIADDVETQQEVDGRWIAEVVSGELGAIAYGETEAKAVINAVLATERARADAAATAAGVPPLLAAEIGGLETMMANPDATSAIFDAAPVLAEEHLEALRFILARPAIAHEYERVLEARQEALGRALDEGATLGGSSVPQTVTAPGASTPVATEEPEAS